MVLRNKEEAAAYKKVVAQRLAEQREARRSLISKRRSTRKSPKTKVKVPNQSSDCLLYNDI